MQQNMITIYTCHNEVNSHSILSLPLNGAYYISIEIKFYKDIIKIFL